MNARELRGTRMKMEEKSESFLCARTELLSSNQFNILALAASDFVN